MVACCGHAVGNADAVVIVVVKDAPESPYADAEDVENVENAGEDHVANDAAVDAEKDPVVGDENAVAADGDDVEGVMKVVLAAAVVYMGCHPGGTEKERMFAVWMVAVCNGDEGTSDPAATAVAGLIDSVGVLMEGMLVAVWVRGPMNMGRFP